MNYCVECGTKLILKECVNYGLSEGMIPFCPKCNDFRFPIFNTAVSTVIFNKDFTKTILIKQYGKDRNILVGGYVNKTENLEKALLREVKEEIGIDVSIVKFNCSEYFERSNSLLCNFITTAENEDLSNISEEVDYADWYDINTAKYVILHNSLAEKFFLEAVKKIV